MRSGEAILSLGWLSVLILVTYSKKSEPEPTGKQSYLRIPEPQIANATSSKEMRRIPPKTVRSGFSESKYIDVRSYDFNNFTVDEWTKDSRDQTTQSYNTVSLPRYQVAVILGFYQGSSGRVVRVYNQQNSGSDQLPLRVRHRRRVSD